MVYNTQPNDPAFATNEEGLTKREYFAALLMQGYLSNGKGFDSAASWAVLAADELIKQLNQ